MIHVDSCTCSSTILKNRQSDYQYIFELYVSWTIGFKQPFINACSVVPNLHVTCWISCPPIVSSSDQVNQCHTQVDYSRSMIGVRSIHVVCSYENLSESRCHWDKMYETYTINSSMCVMFQYWIKYLYLLLHRLLLRERLHQRRHWLLRWETL